MRITLALQHVWLPTLEGMIMPLLVVPPAVGTNGGHVNDFLSPPCTAVGTNGVHVGAFLPPLPTAVETNGVHVDDFSSRLRLCCCCRDEWSAR